MGGVTRFVTRNCKGKQYHSPGRNLEAEGRREIITFQARQHDSCWAVQEAMGLLTPIKGAASSTLLSSRSIQHGIPHPINPTP